MTREWYTVSEKKVELDLLRPSYMSSKIQLMLFWFSLFPSLDYKVLERDVIRVMGESSVFSNHCFLYLRPESVWS